MSLTDHAPVTTNWCSEADARELAARIRDYWASQGKTVRTTIEHASSGRQDGRGVTCVRSDMIRGWPQ